MSTISDLQPLVIRPADERDRLSLNRLAGRDSSTVPAGELLVAEVGGELHAAVSIETGAAIADPFRRTRELVALLRLRAEQRRRPTPLRLVARSPRPAARRRHATA
jgi:hypothetical protein